MKKRIFLLSIILAALSFTSVADEPDNWEFWTRHSSKVLLSNKIDFRISQQFNMNRVMQDLYFLYSEAALSYEFVNWFSATMVFRQAFKHSGESWKTEPRPYINTTAEIESSKWTLTFRNRMVFRYFRESNKYLRLREKYGVSYDINFENLTITPFTSGDLWLDTDNRRIEKYQQYIGTWITPMEKLDIGLHYIGNLINQEPDWKLVNACRISLSIGL